MRERAPQTLTRKRTTQHEQALEVLSVDEAIARYPREWILMEVTELDAQRLPFRGRIVAHSASNRAISKVFVKRGRPSDQPTGPDYQFSGHPRARTGEAARKALAAAAAQEAVGAWRRW